MEEIDDIIAADLPDVEKLAQAFDFYSRRYVTDIRHEGELARAMGDEEAYIKDQIRSGVMRMARDMFAACYRRVTGKGAWDEPQDNT